MNEKLCIECGKYPSEYAQTICEFCMCITNKDDYIEQLQQENENLRANIKTEDIALNTVCEELSTLQQQLKDKDEKISRVISFSKSQINIIKQQPSNDTSVDNYFIDKLLDIIETLENNKED